MATVPKYVQALPAEHLRNLISSSAAFQAWVGAANESAALSWIFYADVPTIPANGIFVCIGPPQDEEDSFRLTSRGAPNDYAVAGRLHFVVRAKRTTTDSIADQVLAFWNAIGLMVEQWVANSGTTGANGARLAFTELHCT
ncbi:MAG: hypothetical protein AMJ84_06490, partial [Acidithiobacillales bacterium SM23_46]